MKNIFLRPLALATLITASSLAASEGYLGLSVGQTDYDLKNAYSFDHGDSFAISGGYRFNENFALELSYIDLGDGKDNVDPVWTVEVDGFNLAAVGIIPISKQFELFAKVGMFKWDGKVDEKGTGKIADGDGTELSYGAGLAYNLSSQFSIVLEYQVFDFDDGDDADNISAGVRYNF